MKKFLIPIALFALIGVLLGYALLKMTQGELSPRTIPSPLVGKPLPAFDLATLHDPDKRLSNADLRGRNVLVNVWASWCVSCRAEHEVLVALARSGQLPVIGLNFKDTAADAHNFLAQLGNPYEVSLVDPNGRTGIDWGVYAVPESFLIDGNGVILYKHIGPLTHADVEQKILPLVQKTSFDKP